MMPQRIFISASRDDAHRAAELRRYISAAGFKTVINGSNYSIRQADGVIVVLSPSAIRSGLVRSAVEQAQATGTAIIPVLIDGATVPGLFREMGVIDLRPGDLTPLIERLRQPPPLPPFEIPPIPPVVAYLLAIIMTIGGLLTVGYIATTI